MAKKSISQLKSYFRKGTYPTESQFADLIDSFRHHDDNIQMAEIDELPAALNSKYDAAFGKALELTQQEHASAIDLLKIVQNNHSEAIEDLKDECARSVIYISARVSDVNVEESATPASSRSHLNRVVYNAKTKRLLLAVPGQFPTLKAATAQADFTPGDIQQFPVKYYADWADAASFGKVTADGVEMSSGRLYICTDDEFNDGINIFFWKDADLVSLHFKDFEELTDKLHDIEAVSQLINEKTALIESNGGVLTVNAALKARAEKAADVVAGNYTNTEKSTLNNYSVQKNLLDIRREIESTANSLKGWSYDRVSEQKGQFTTAGFYKLDPVTGDEIAENYYTTPYLYINRNLPMIVEPGTERSEYVVAVYDSDKKFITAYSDNDPGGIKIHPDELPVNAVYFRVSMSHDSVSGGGNYYTGGLEPREEAIMQQLEAKLAQIKEQNRPRTIRDGFARTGMKPQFAYKVKMLYVDEGRRTDDGKKLCRHYPAVVVSGFRNRHNTQEEVSLETAFPGGKFMGIKIRIYDATNAGKYEYNSERNTVICNKSKKADQNTCYVLLPGVNLNGKYLTTDATGRVIAIDAAMCHEEALRPLDAADLQIAKVDSYLRPNIRKGLYDVVDDGKEPYIVRLRILQKSDGREIINYGRDVHVEVQKKHRRYRTFKTTDGERVRRGIVRWRSKGVFKNRCGTFRARAVTRSAMSSWRYFSYWVEYDDTGKFKCGHIKEIRIGEGRMPLRTSSGAYRGRDRKRIK